MADEKRATPHDVLIARVMDVNRAKSDEEWAAAREIERLRAQLDKPEVAPDDEALIVAAVELSAEYQAAKPENEAAAFNARNEAIETLRRRIAELVQQAKNGRNWSDFERARAEAAEAALAACRAKTIEADDATVLLVAKAIAPTYGDTPEIAWAHLTARGEEGLYLAQARDAIRALKDKEPPRD